MSNDHLISTPESSAASERSEPGKGGESPTASQQPIEIPTNRDYKYAQKLVNVSIDKRLIISDLVADGMLNYQEISEMNGISKTQVAAIVTQRTIADPEFAAKMKQRLAASASVNAQLLSDSVQDDILNGDGKKAMSHSISAGVWIDKASLMAGGNQVVEHHHYRKSADVGKDWIDVTPTESAT